MPRRRPNFRRVGTGNLTFDDYRDLIRMYLSNMVVSIKTIDMIDVREYFKWCQILLPQKDIQDIIRQMKPLFADYSKDGGYTSDDGYKSFVAGYWEDLFPIHFYRDTVNETKFHNVLYGITRKVWQNYNQEFNSIKSGLMKRILHIQNIFELDENSTMILTFLFLASQGISMFQNNIILMSSDVETISIFTGLSKLTVINTIKKNNKLFSHHIILDINNYANTDFENSIEEYLGGFIVEDELMNTHILRDNKTALRLNSFSIEDKDVNIMQSLLSSDRVHHVLLYGVPGTGKTEFARAIVNSIGKKPVFLSYKHKRFLTDNDIWVGLHFAQNIITSKEVLIIDEADSILNTMKNADSFGKKSEINSYLDSSKISILWITNHTNWMEESLQRRFSFSIPFRLFDDSQRLQVWENLFKKSPLKKYFTKNDIQKLSEDYVVNAGAISSSLNSIESIENIGDMDIDDIKDYLKHFLKRQQQIKRENKPKNIMKKINSNYNVSWLNTKPEYKQIITMLKTIQENIKNDDEDFNGVNLLFWGHPGTGKTEFVKYIAKTLDKKLIVKRYSDLESKWLGETSQNIAVAFNRASKEKAILFFDEADSMFTERTSAFRSFEVSRTNEMLTQMENFDGILICATNLLKNLDSAAMRRFQFKVEFKPLAKQKRLLLFKKFFGKKGMRISPIQKRKIESLSKLTFGDAYAISSRVRYLGNAIDYSEIIEMLKTEILYRDSGKSEVGFK